jgi:hypothetical protein
VSRISVCNRSFVDPISVMVDSILLLNPQSVYHGGKDIKGEEVLSRIKI